TFKVGQAVVAMRSGAQPRPLGLFKVTEVNAGQIVCQLTKALPGGEGAEAEVGEEVRLIPAPPSLNPGKPNPGGSDVPPPGWEVRRPGGAGCGFTARSRWPRLRARFNVESGDARRFPFFWVRCPGALRGPSKKMESGGDRRAPW